MLNVIIGKDSEVATLRAKGVVERPKKPEWAADQHRRPFNQREYGHPYKTITRGLKKRT